MTSHSFLNGPSTTLRIIPPELEPECPLPYSKPFSHLGLRNRNRNYLHSLRFKGFHNMASLLQSHLFLGCPLALLCSKADHTSPLFWEALPNRLQFNSVTPGLLWCFPCEHVEASPGSFRRNPEAGPPHGPTCDIHMTHSSALNFPACVTSDWTWEPNPLGILQTYQPTQWSWLLSFDWLSLDFYYLTGYAEKENQRMRL